MATRSAAPTRSGPPPRGPQSNRRPPWVWIGLGVLVLAAAIIAVVASSGGDSKKTSTTIPTGVKQTRPVTVNGQALPTYGDGNDPAVGKTAPELKGEGFDGKPVNVTHDGRPKLLLFVAHWCPHCQREVPLLAGYLKAHPVPAGIDLIAVATSTSANDPNYPPSAWLAREHWPSPVMADSADFAAAKGYGLSAFPYFVALDSNHKVIGRTSGEISTDQFAQLMSAAAKKT